VTSSLSFPLLYLRHVLRIREDAEAVPVNLDDVLSKYSLTPETAARYVDIITHKNQTDTAEEIGVSRDTVNRYKKAFDRMKTHERLLVISTLAQEQLIEELETQP